MANVIPLPEKVLSKSGKPFQLTNSTKIVSRWENLEIDRIILFFISDVQQQTKENVNLSVFDHTTNTEKRVEWNQFGTEANKGNIVIQQIEIPKSKTKKSEQKIDEKSSKENIFKEDPADEQYVIEANYETVTVGALTPHGIFNAIQTLNQLIVPTAKNATTWQILPVEIRDRPKFSWRGMLFDVSRHFFGVNEIKKFIDSISMYKFNKLHLHLVDDQGWRIEIKSFPELTKIGSNRSSSPLPGEPDSSDGVPYEGHYTQDEVREIVTYASERYVMVIPEIEIPGHNQEVISAYSHFGNYDIPNWEVPETRTSWGVSNFTLNANVDTIQFLQTVLDELIDLFPAPWFHIGGDEAPTVQWDQSQMAQDAILRLGLENSRELQGYFTAEMGRYLNTRGRILIGWNEILEGKGLPQDACVMVWNNPSAAVDAVRQGHPVVTSFTSHTYLDFYQSRITQNEPEAIGGYLPIEKVYSFDPIPDGLTSEEESLIMGPQGQLWTEYIRDMSHLEYMSFPRAIALAEVGWSISKTPYDEFRRRLVIQLERLKTLGVNYRQLDPVEENPDFLSYVIDSLTSPFRAIGHVLGY